MLQSPAGAPTLNIGAAAPADSLTATQQQQQQQQGQYIAADHSLPGRLFYLSPCGTDVLTSASSCCEYVGPARRARVLQHGMSPFAHDAMLASGQLTVLGPTQRQAGSNSSSSAVDWAAAVDAVHAAGPCIAFVPLSSLIGGAASCQGSLLLGCCCCCCMCVCARCYSGGRYCCALHECATCAC
jgi:hypothetical protein